LRICSRCSRESPDEGKFCMSCGADFSGLTVPIRRFEPETSGKAIASLVCGFLSLIPPAAVLAIVFGHISRAEISKSAGRLKGKGMALAGLIFGYAGLMIIPFLIIVAIAIPNLLRARSAANQASAIGSLRTLNWAADAYASTYNHGFPHSLADLGPPSGNQSPGPQAAALIKSVLASGLKSGYKFTYVPGKVDSGGYALAYTIQADPATDNSPGERHFFTDQTGIIRMEPDKPADINSPLVQ
jgi:type IV pilus assembly protein PilA